MELIQCIINVKHPDSVGLSYGQWSRIEVFGISGLCLSLHRYSHFSLINKNKLYRTIPHRLACLIYFDRPVEYCRVWG